MYLFNTPPRPLFSRVTPKVLNPATTDGLILRSYIN
nr:MAG TPA_asm: hypothetical protein [Caudoviricetes sp.]